MPTITPTPANRRPGRRTLASATVALALTAAAVTSAASVASAHPTAPAAPARAAACSTSGTGFCDDFENQTGTTPAGRWTPSAANCSGTGNAVVDSSTAHSGSKSLRVNGKGGYCNHAFAGTSLSGISTGGDLFVRLWVRHTTPLPQGHVAFAVMKDNNDGPRDLRLGGQNSALQWNRESDDATLPEQSPVGVSLSKPLPVNTWSCLEYQISQSAGRLNTWLDGTAVTGLTVDGVPTQDVDSQWLRKSWRPALTDLRLGWESYAGGDDTLWYDDVAVGTSRIGC